MKKKILAFSCCLIFILVFTVYALYSRHEIVETHSLVAMVSRAELIDRAAVIIRGTVVEVLPSSWSNPNFSKGEHIPNIIQTDILINIHEVYKGTPYNKKTLTVRIDKGTVGNTTVKSSGYPDFNIGEEVILFLSEDDGVLATGEDYYLVTGMLQGKFTLVKDFKNKFPDDKVFENKFSKERFEKSTIVNEIEETLNELKKNP